MSNYVDIGCGRLYQGDCLEVMKEFPSGCVDMVMCDLPYGTTQNKWDSIVPLDRLWEQYKRICKGAIVLTAQSPFDKILGTSCIEMMRYEWIWLKSKATGHLNSNRAPLKNHENVLVFYNTKPIYNPQGLIKKTVPTIRKGRNGNGSNYGKSDLDAIQEYENYPRSVIEISSEVKSVHPTQKPVALMEYLIKTYTNEGMIVLDNCSGSGTTAIACENLNRRWVCIEQDEEYCTKSYNRIKQHVEELAAMPPPDPEGWTTKL